MSEAPEELVAGLEPPFPNAAQPGVSARRTAPAATHTPQTAPGRSTQKISESPMTHIRGCRTATYPRREFG